MPPVCLRPSHRLLLAVLAAVCALGAAQPASAGTLTTTAAPNADAYVSQAQPKVNFGLATALSVSNTSDVRNAYLRFAVNGLTAPVTSATLRVWAQGASSDGVGAWTTNGANWTETGITYQNAPSLKKALSTSGAYAAGAYVSLPVTALITGNGTFSVALRKAGTARTTVAFDSREGAHPPQLLVTTTDTTAPLVSITSPVAGALLSSATPAISGTAGTAAGDLPGITVKLYAGTTATGTPVQTRTTTASGSSWSVAAAPLADGTYTAQAEQTDTHGNVGRSAARTFSVDATAPAVTLTTPSGGAQLATHTPGLAGAAGAAPGDAATVTVRIWSGAAASGTPLQSISAARSGGAWSTTAASLPDGVYTARAEQSDTAGNLGTSAAVTFTVDTTAPAPAITAPSAGSVLRTSGPTVAGTAGTATGDVPSVTLELYAGPQATGLPASVTSAGVSAAGTWSAALTGLADGAWTARVVQTDAAGNRGAGPTVTFSIDTAAPALAIDAPADGSRLATTPAITGTAGVAADDETTVAVDVFAGTDTTGTSLQALSAPIADGRWSAQPASLADGTYTARARQRDAAGNTSTATVTFAIDTGAPAIGLDTPADGGVTADATPDLAGPAGTSTGDGATVSVDLFAGSGTGGTTLQSATVAVAGGRWATTAAALDDGTYTVRVRQADSAGNTATATATFAVRTTIPSVSLGQPADGAVLADATPDLSGSADTGPGSAGEVTARIWSGTDTTGTPVEALDAAVSAGTWTTTATTLADGTYTAIAAQDGVAGTGHSTTHVFTVDTTAPSVAVDTPDAGATTGDPTPTLAGPAGAATGDDAGVDVGVFSGSDTTGTLEQTATVSVSGGRWSVDAAPLADGAHTVRVRQRDAAGNLGSATRTFTVHASYAQAVQLDQPTDYWRLGETSGLTAASETSADAGTYLKGVLLGEPGAIAGDPNAAVRFDGVNDTVSVPSAARLNPTDALSIEAWVKPDGLPASTATIARKDGQYLVRLTSTGAVLLRLWKGSNQKDLTTPAGLVTASAWNHVVATFDGATMSVYVNGGLHAATALAGPISATTNPLTLASSLTTNDFLKGWLDEVAIYDQALSAARVRAHWEASGVPDISAPTVTIGVPTGGSTDGDPTPRFTGTAGTDPGDLSAVTLRVYAGTSATGTPLAELPATATSGAWSVAAASALDDGTYTAQAAQADAAGNVGRSDAVTFRVARSASWNAVRADAPRAWWRLGETGGTLAANEMSAADTGTYLKGVLLGATGAVTGDANAAATFDGVNDTVAVPSSVALQLGAQMTLETWVKPDAMPASTATLLRKDGEYLLRITHDGNVLFRVWVPTAPGGVWNLGTAPYVRAGSWNHIVATLDGTSTAVYVNGVRRATGALYGPAAAAGDTPLYLGSSTGTSDFLAGTLDDTAIYGSVLPGDRVRAHFDAAAVAPPAPQVRLQSPADGSTMDATPTFGGHAEPGMTTTATVNVFAGSGTSGTPVQTLSAALSPAGTFSVQAAAALASGVYTAQAVQQAPDGPVTSSTTFTVDASLPPQLLVAGDVAGCDTFGDEATAALLDRLPGVVVPDGDLVYEDATSSDFDNCYDPSWGRHKARSRPASGAHEYRTPDAAGYFGYWGAAAGQAGEGWYSYDLGSWHVVSLSSECEQIGGCGAGSPEETWLHADLQRNRAQCTIAILHEPRFSSGAEHGDNGTYQAFWEDLYAAGVEAVVSGSDHLYERFAPQTPTGELDPDTGIREFVAGTGGRSHYPFGPIAANSIVHDDTTYGVLRLVLRDGSYDWEFVPQAGGGFTDSGSATCH